MGLAGLRGAAQLRGLFSEGLCSGLGWWRGHERVGVPLGAALPALRGSRPPWARCRGQLPLPCPGLCSALPVPGTSYLGNVRNAPHWGFPCSAGGVCQEQTPPCPARRLPAPGVSICRGQGEDGVRGASPSWLRGTAWGAGGAGGNPWDVAMWGERWDGMRPPVPGLGHRDTVLSVATACGSAPGPDARRQEHIPAT